MVIRLLIAICLSIVFGWVTWCWSAYTVERYRNGGRLYYRDVRALLAALVHSRLEPSTWLFMAFFTLLAMYGAWSLSWPWLLDMFVVTSLLLILAYVDFRVHRLPNVFLGGLLLWAIVRSFWLAYPSLLSLALGAFIGGGLFLLIALIGRGAMGMGDVKLAVAVGALLGYPFVWIGLFVGIVFGGVSALTLLALRRVGRKDYMAYGPYLALGAWIIYMRLGMLFNVH